MNLHIGDIVIELIRKPIKNIYIRIDREGGVKVSAPRACSDDYIKQFVESKQDWILKHTKIVKARQPYSSLQFISGESHWYLGNPYCLTIQTNAKKNQIELAPPLLHFFVKENSTQASMEKIMYAWYRSELKKILPALITKWESIIGVQVQEWGIKRMKTRWGTCNPRAQRIWLNLSLIKKPLRCLEYVLVHEMVHLLEASHNKRFYAFMDRFLPEWKVIRKELKTFENK
ncbi:M48 family metallopeptidase [Legionella yabuuchiae]|uniref:M48 family metallopeptidase n=1 Tax=Legionella yabuuchiae TaxID=376727 RepID=UPI001056C97F|nr:SprT family zinc-dependent metalloprotease [Legionella yabuuchiae]